MPDISWLSVINTGGLLLVGIFSYLNNQKAKELHILVNSRLSELLDLTEKSAHAAGVLQQKGIDDAAAAEAAAKGKDRNA